MTLTVVPAYGVDFKNKAEVQAHFDANKDFLIQDASCLWDGKYINAQQLEVGHSLTVRYGGLRKVCIITKKG